METCFGVHNVIVGTGSQLGDEDWLLHIGQCELLEVVDLVMVPVDW